MVKNDTINSLLSKLLSAAEEGDHTVSDHR